MEVNLTADAATSAVTGSQSGQENGQTAARLYALQDFEQLKSVPQFRGADLVLLRTPSLWEAHHFKRFLNRLTILNSQNGH